MKDRIEALMIEAGYAAPEIAGRAQRLADLMAREAVALCSVYSSNIDLSKQTFTEYEQGFMAGQDHCRDLLIRWFEVTDIK